jgi:hypothetical protein
MIESNEYVNNQRFVDLIKKWKATGDRITYNEIGKEALLIACNNLRRPCFSRYSYDRKVEMLSDAVWYIIKKLPTYDPSIKPNPFSYFTRTVYNAIRQKINEYSKRDSRIKPISYIENIEEKSFSRSFTFRDDNRDNYFDDKQDDKLERSPLTNKKFLTDDEVKKEIKKYKKDLKCKKSHS